MKYIKYHNIRLQYTKRMHLPKCEYRLLNFLLVSVIDRFKKEKEEEFNYELRF